MRRHAVKDILKYFSLLVQCFAHLPLQQVHIPQVALSQHAVQHDGGGRLHLYRHAPTPQRVSIPYLDSGTRNWLDARLTICSCIFQRFYPKKHSRQKNKKPTFL